MFVQRDTRKIEEILREENGKPVGEALFLSRRHTEFPNANFRDAFASVDIIPVLKSLERLSLYDNKLKRLDGFGVLSHCFRLRTIDLGNNLLTELPDDLGEFLSLEHLALENNRFSSFPNCLLNLISLNSLKLSGNKLVELPDTLGKLSTLESLSLDNNLIQKLPSCMKDLKNLVYLNLRGNLLTELPSQMLNNLTSLKSLILSSNKIKELKDVLRLKSLETVLCNSNALTSFPEGLEQLENLNRANFSHNKIHTIPDTLLALGDKLTAVGLMA